MAARYNLTELIAIFDKYGIAVTPDVEEALKEIIDRFIPDLRIEYDPLEEEFNQNILNGLPVKITYNELGLIATEECGNIRKVYQYAPVVDPSPLTPAVTGFTCERYYFERIE